MSMLYGKMTATVAIRDILFTVSNDNGQTFVDPPTDLSKNTGQSGINISFQTTDDSLWQQCLCCMGR